MILANFSIQFSPSHFRKSDLSFKKKRLFSVMVAIHFTVKTAEMNSVVNIVKRCTATNSIILLTSAKEVIETSSFVQSKEVLCRTTITFSKYTINQSINQSISFNSSNFLSLYIYTKRTQYAGYYRV